MLLKKLAVVGPTTVCYWISFAPVFRFYLQLSPYLCLSPFYILIYIGDGALIS